MCELIARVVVGDSPMTDDAEPPALPVLRPRGAALGLCAYETLILSSGDALAVAYARPEEIDDDEDDPKMRAQRGPLEAIRTRLGITRRMHSALLAPLRRPLQQAAAARKLLGLDSQASLGLPFYRAASLVLSQPADPNDFAARQAGLLVALLEAEGHSGAASELAGWVAGLSQAF